MILDELRFLSEALLIEKGLLGNLRGNVTRACIYLDIGGRVDVETGLCPLCLPVADRKERSRLFIALNAERPLGCRPVGQGEPARRESELDQL